VSRQLYGELVGPIRKHLSPEVDSLVLIPDDVLHYLPFETLIQDEGSGSRSAHPYLLKDFTISYAPSATVLWRLSTGEGSASGSEHASIAVFADPIVNPGLLAPDNSAAQLPLARSLYAEEGLQVSPIPFSAAEAHAIEEYAGPGGRVYLGAEATEDVIKAGALEGFDAIHFATHVLISQRMPARSALVLGTSAKQDGFLQVREIRRLRLKSRLVVLSGCRTARGQLLAGEGVRGLAQAFFYAGAQSVVASLWDVDDEWTSSIMKAFYGQLAKANSKAAALRAAKLELLEENPELSPRYWGAFVLIGEARGNVSIAKTGSGLRWLPIAIALAFIALAIAYSIARRGFGQRRKDACRDVSAS
jgi:CHAT domain-containing protein